MNRNFLDNPFVVRYNLNDDRQKDYEQFFPNLTDAIKWAKKQAKNLKIKTIPHCFIGIYDSQNNMLVRFSELT